MKSTNDSIHDAFVHVRKAFRLLHEYQCMVRDAVRYIGSRLDFEEKATGRAVFVDDDARQGYRNLEQRSWAWLPMMACEFHFRKTLRDAGWLSLSFFIISDTGFIEGDGNAKEDLAAYKKAEESSTKLALILRKNNWEAFEFMEDKIQLRNFLRPGGSLPDSLINAGYIGKCYDLWNLSSEENADKVVDDVDAFAKKRWKLNLKKPNVS